VLTLLIAVGVAFWILSRRQEEEADLTPAGNAGVWLVVVLLFAFLLGMVPLLGAALAVVP
jgi:hypothetical protein